MALPSSGAISCSQINTELSFASNATISLGSTSVRNLAGVASGAISMSNLYGKSAVSATISISDRTNGAYNVDAVATAAYRLGSDGIVYGGENGGYYFIENWITPQSGMADYEALATVTSGTLSSGTAGTWLNLGTTQTWTRTKGGASSGTSTVTFTVQIRKVGTTTVLDTATITLGATVDSSAGGGMTL